MRKENCPFLNTSGTVRYPDEHINIQIMDSKFLGKYRISLMALNLIESYRNQNKIKDLNITQSLVNCANKILKANELGSMPFVVPSDQYINYKKTLEPTEKRLGQAVTLISLEEAMNEKVDHTLKANALLLQFARKVEHNHAFSHFNPSIKDMVLAKIAGVGELVAVLEHLCEEKYISGAVLNGFSPGYEPEEEAPFNDEYSFTMKGWEKIREEKEKINTNKVFIATSFHWEKGDNTLRLEVMDAIKRACERLGWVADIVSQSHTDFITDKILSEIRSCKFVVAELTYHNRGVYFESGYARGLGKNVFHMVHKDFTKTNREADAEAKRMHFDIQQVQYRSWEIPAEAEEKLYDWINSTVGKYSEI